MLAGACLPGKGDGEATTGATATTSAAATTTDTSSAPTTAAETAATSTTRGPSTTGTSVDSSAGTTGGCSFVCDKEDLDQPECDGWQQDCPRGEKCNPADRDGSGFWDTYVCTPVSPNPHPLLEPCAIQGDPLSGIDDCDVGLVCWDPDRDGVGYCLSLCSGPHEAPVCPLDHTCWIGGSGFPSTCLVTCDPLNPACPLGENCVDLYSLGQAFVCLGPGPSAAGEGCANSLHCAAGLICVYDPDCAGGNGCCTPYCDLEAADPCAPELADAKCLPYFGDDPPPPEYAHLGYCDLPP